MIAVDNRFKKGLELFWRKEYFECHEIIEELWHETPADDGYRNLYKGVIQAAAAIYQLERGILSGARGLYGSSVEYLKKYSPMALGLDVDALMKHLKNRFRDIQ